MSGLALRVNRDQPDAILLEIDVDGKLEFSLAVLDERPDMETDPVLLVWNDTGDENPIATVHRKEAE